VSTNDVPGANPKNADVLALGCWAEHEDGSLILVESVEAGTAVYSIFDVGQDPPVEYRDAMQEKGFKERFSWTPEKAKKDKGTIKWTWHDKTPFPWQKVMRDFPAGQRQVSAGGLLNAAQRVAESLKLRADKVRTRPESPAFQRAATKIMEGIKDAILSLKE